MKIDVDRKQLTSSASAIDSYVEAMKKHMDSADSEVRNLASVWEGRDYAAFQSRWNKVTDRDSVYTNWQNALKNYAELLRFAEEKYKNAQKNAVERANRLPRW